MAGSVGDEVHVICGVQEVGHVNVVILSLDPVADAYVETVVVAHPQVLILEGIS